MNAPSGLGIRKKIDMGKDWVTSSGTGPGGADEQATAVRIGDLLGRRYRIEEEIGRGGMAVVYRAVNTVGTLVAIKTPHAATRSDPGRCQRFLQETRALALLAGARHVVQVLDKHEGGDGVPPYLVMELLKGCDLGRELEKGPLSQGETVDFALQICDALADAHLAGLVHRDLKPSNLFLSRDSEGGRTLKILDLGVAKIPLPDSVLVTETGTFVGSAPYASPEQIRSARSADERSDVWSLGVTLYEMLTGRRPFNGRTRADIEVSVRQAIVRPSVLRPQISAGIEEIILACLEKEPADRPSVAQLARRLSDFAPCDLRSRAESIERRLGASSTHGPASDPAPPAHRAERPSMSAERSTLTPTIAAGGARAESSTAKRRATASASLALGMASALVAIALVGGHAASPLRADTPAPAAYPETSCTVANSTLLTATTGLAVESPPPTTALPSSTPSVPASTVRPPSRPPSDPYDDEKKRDPDPPLIARPPQEK